jgi:hypothetical protein
MSQWTHVNGCIRIDGIPNIEDNVDIKSIREILGITCRYNSPDKRWKECNVPCGSEASIQYKIISAGHGLVLWTVAVWGDLRDFGSKDVKKIRKWFKKITEESGLSIRSAILEIRIEYGKTIVLRYKEKE